MAKVTVPNKVIYDVPGYPVNHLINSTVLKIVRTGEELTYSEVVLFYNILYQACDSLLGNQGGLVSKVPFTLEMLNAIFDAM